MALMLLNIPPHMDRFLNTMLLTAFVSILSLLPSQTRGTPQLTLPLYKLTMDQSSLDALNGNPWSNRTFPAIVEVEGDLYTCRVRYRGRSGRDLPKKSWKIYYDDDSPFGRSEINLNSEYRDRSLVRNHIAMKLNRFVGQPAPDTRFVSLIVNDTYMGVFLEVEQVDREFLERRELGFGTLWKAIAHGARFTPFTRNEDYNYNYESKITGAGSLDSLIARFTYISYAGNDQFRRNIGDLIDIQNFLYYFAIQYVLASYDCFTKNFYIYRRPDDRWLLIPWDCEASLGNDWRGEWIDYADRKYTGMLDQQAVMQRLIAIPEYRARFLSIIDEIVAYGFPYLSQRTAEVFDEIRHDAYLDTAKRGSNAEFEQELIRLTDWLERRESTLENIDWFNRREIISTSVQPEYISSRSDTFRICAVLPERAYSVSAHLLDRDGSEHAIRLYDDGSHGDETAGDLTYTSDVSLPDKPAPFHYGIYVRPNNEEGSYNPPAGWAFYYLTKPPLPAIRIDDHPPEAGDLVFTTFHRIPETGTCYFGVVNVSGRPVNLSDCFVSLGRTYRRMQLRELEALAPGDSLIIANQLNIAGGIFPGLTVTGPFCFTAQAGDTLMLETSGGRFLSARTIEHIDISGETVGKVVINEINYNSADDFDTGDWIELYCLEDELDIGNWVLLDNRDEHRYVIPEGTMLHRDEYLVIARDPATFSNYFPDVINIMGGFDFGFGGGGDDVRLLDDSGFMIDWVSYDDDAPWPGRADGGGATLELVNPLKPNFSYRYWGASDDSSAHGTPGVRNSIYRILEDPLPDRWGFELICPNPFNSRLLIRWGQLAAGNLKLTLFDIQGRELDVLANEWHTSGRHEVIWKAGAIPAGMYILRLEQLGMIEVKKVVYLK